MAKFSRKSLLFFALLFSVVCAAQDAEETDSADDLVPPASSFADRSTFPGCDNSAMPRKDRIEKTDLAVAEAETELEKNPDVARDIEARYRIGTFAAGTMKDSILSVSLDRECWTNFHEAQMELRAGKERSARKSADKWVACLRRNFPNRAELAEPYAACFGAAPKMSKTKSK